MMIPSKFTLNEWYTQYEFVAKKRDETPNHIIFALFYS